MLVSASASRRWQTEIKRGANCGQNINSQTRKATAFKSLRCKSFGFNRFLMHLSKPWMTEYKSVQGDRKVVSKGGSKALWVGPRTRERPPCFVLLHVVSIR